MSAARIGTRAAAPLTGVLGPLTRKSQVFKTPPPLSSFLRMRMSETGMWALGGWCGDASPIQTFRTRLQVGWILRPCITAMLGLWRLQTVMRDITNGEMAN